MLLLSQEAIMKFWITSTGYNVKTKYGDILNKYNIEDGKYIEINSLEMLIQLINDLKQEIIIDTSIYAKPNEPIIEIYDSYRE
jgi:hypothetical protein